MDYRFHNKHAISDYLSMKKEFVESEKVKLEKKAKKDSEKYRLIKK